jgi:hypothetical protein
MPMMYASALIVGGRRMPLVYTDIILLLVMFQTAYRNAHIFTPAMIVCLVFYSLLYLASIFVILDFKLRMILLVFKTGNTSRGYLG